MEATELITRLTTIIEFQKMIIRRLKNKMHPSLLEGIENRVATHMDIINYPQLRKAMTLEEINDNL